MNKVVIMNRTKIDLKIFKFKSKEMIKDVFMKYSIQKDFKEKYIMELVLRENISLL